MVLLAIFARLLVLGTLAFLAVMPVLVVALLWQYVRRRRCGAALLVACAVAAGFVLGGVVVWNVVPPAWQMSFQTTLAASVNAEKYGHEIEHAAENILVCVAFGGMLGALAAGAIAATAARLRTAR